MVGPERDGVDWVEGRGWWRGGGGGGWEGGGQDPRVMVVTHS